MWANLARTEESREEGGRHSIAAAKGALDVATSLRRRSARGGAKMHVDVRAFGAARASRCSDLRCSAKRLTHAHADRGQMRVSRIKAACMQDCDEVAIATCVAVPGKATGTSGDDRSGGN